MLPMMTGTEGLGCVLMEKDPALHLVQSLLVVTKKTHFKGSKQVLHAKSYSCLICLYLKKDMYLKG